MNEPLIIDLLSYALSFDEYEDMRYLQVKALDAAECAIELGQGIDAYHAWAWHTAACVRISLAAVVRDWRKVKRMMEEEAWLRLAL